MRLKNTLALTLAAIIGADMYRDASGGAVLPDFNAKGDLQRKMEVSSFDVEKRTVELAFSSEIEVQRWFGFEILDHDATSIRLDRLRDGGAILVDHDWSDQVGVVESVTIGADRRGRAVVRFGKSARANEIFQDVVDGIRKHVSVGYRVLGAKLQETRDEGDVYRVTDWEPFEISFVSVPADHSVGVGRSLNFSQEEQQREVNETAATGKQTPANQLPSEVKRNMDPIILRDGSGNLVRAYVDEAGNITKIVEVLEKAGDDIRAAETRAAAAATARVNSILSMGRQYGAQEIAQRAIEAGTSAADFQTEVLELLNTRGARPNGGTQARGGNTPLGDQTAADAAIGLTDAEVRRYSIFNAVRAQQPNATRAEREAAAFEIECSEAAQRAQPGREVRGILIPDDVLRSRAFNAGGAPDTPVGAQTGHVLVDTQLMTGSFIEMLRARTTIMRLAQTMGGLVGNVDIPKQTGGATAYWIGEGQDAPEGTPTLGQLGLTPHTVAAYTDITRRLLMQSTPDAEGIVRRDLVSAIAQAIDVAAYYSDGTGVKPKGLKYMTGINAVAFASVQPSYAELVQMESEVAADNADVNNMAYVLNSGARGAAKTTPKFAAGASVADAGVIWEPGNTINGYRAEVTNQVANGDVFFGNFADFIIGMWGGLDLTVDPYSLSKSGGLRIVVFQDVDFAIRRVESFAYGKKAA